MAEYIERESAIEAVTVWYKKSCRPENMSSYNMGERAAYTTAICEITELPGADVRPVVRGKWVENYEPYSTGEEWVEAQYGYECSVCGRWEYEKEPFCNCGAMMEES